MSNDTKVHSSSAVQRKETIDQKLTNHYRDVSLETWREIGGWDQEPLYLMLHKWALEYMCTEPVFVKYTHNYTLAHPWQSLESLNGIKKILEKAPAQVDKDGLTMRLIAIKHVAYILDGTGKKLTTVDKLTINY